MQVNIVALKKACVENPTYKSIFEMYGKRVRGRQSSTVPRARRVLKEAGIDVSEKAMVEFYNLMQKAGVGRWVAGRNGQKGRFVWRYHLRSIADAVNGVRYEFDSKTKSFSAKVLPKNASIELEEAPKPKHRLPEYDELEPAPAALALEPEVKVDRQPGGKTIRISRGGFVIDLPVNMTPDEAKDAASFLAALTG